MHCKETVSAIQRANFRPAVCDIPGVDSRKGPLEDFDTLIQRIDEMCREAERTRSYARALLSRRPFYPDRRRRLRMPDFASGTDNNSNEAA
jgi:hypothetical protein